MLHDCHSYSVEERRFCRPTHNCWYTGSPSERHCGLYIKKFHTCTTEHDHIVKKMKDYKTYAMIIAQIQNTSFGSL